MQKKTPVLLHCAAAALLVPGIGGCSLISNTGMGPAAEPRPSADARPAAELLPEMEVILPELLALGGGDSPLAVREFREVSCLDPIEDDNWNTETRPLAWMTGSSPDHGTARATMDAWKSHLEAKQWIHDNEWSNPPDTNGDVQVMLYHHGDLELTARYDHAELNGSRVLEVLITGSCTENPEDHQMIRSRLDPGYGLHSSYYDYAAEKAQRDRP